MCNEDDLEQTLAPVLARAEGDATWARAQIDGTGAVARVEARLREHYGMRYAVCVSSATTGLLALGLALGLRGTEFVTTPCTYGGTLGGWLLLGARPRFADICAETFTLDPGAARRVLGLPTRAILSVDLHGTPADDAALRALADERGLWYISDAAQSLGARIDGRPASSLAHALVTSFTVGKPLSVGEGGAVLTNEREVYERVLWFSQHPARQGRELGLSLVNEFGINGRIAPLSAVWADASFPGAMQRLASRQEAYERAAAVLATSGLLEPLPARAVRLRPSYFRLAAMWRTTPRPAQLSALLHAAGLRAHLSAPPPLIYRQPAFRAQFSGRYRIPNPCRVAERYARRGVLLRLEPPHA